MPKVTVVIPTYNRRGPLVQALRTVVAQSYGDYEVIVVDDGSDDGTSGVLAEFGNRVRYVFQRRAGPGRARNHGVTLASGELIAFLDSDDRWEPEHLAMEVAVFERYPQCALVCSRAEIDRRGEDRTLDAGNVICGDLYASLFQHNFVRTPGAMVRRRCVEDLGGFNESYECFEDYDLWLRIAARYAIARVERRSVHLGRRDDNLSRRSTAHREVILRILEANRDPRRISEAVYRQRVSNCRLSLARFEVMNGRADRGWRHWRSARDLTPLRLRPYRYLVKMLGYQLAGARAWLGR